MIAFDTSFLIDYLDGVEAAATYLQDHEEKPFFAPTLALFEVYRGAARVGEESQIATAVTGLDWLQPLPLDHAAAKDAARIEAELRDDGRDVNLGDTLIAGMCRHHGARLVTRDPHFDRIEGLDVDSY